MNSDDENFDERIPNTTGDQRVEPVWCVVANVVEESGYGVDGAERRRGTKHFPPGAKVYCRRFHWKAKETRVEVVGRHRRSHRYVNMIVSAKRLRNWRAMLVYSPHVIRQLKEHWDGSPEAKAYAEGLALVMNGGTMPWGVTRAWTEHQQRRAGRRSPTFGIFSFFRRVMRRILGS